MTRIISRTTGVGAPHTLPREWHAPAVEASDGSQARLQAAKILLEARLTARTLVATAEATVEAGRQMGREQGYAQGLRQAQQEQAQSTQRLAMLVRNAAVDQQASAQHLDEMVVNLALTLARAVVHHETTAAPHLILHVARAALTEVSAQTAVTIRLHPDDAALLQTQIPALDLPATVQLTLFPDPQVTPGGCCIESGGGKVDATVEKQFERFGSLLDDQLRASGI